MNKSRKTADQKRAEITEIKFPDESYPVMYMSYWSDFLDDTYKVENNTTGIYTDIYSTVYKNYYNLLLDLNTLTDITYDNERTPYQLVVILRYKTNNGVEGYLWEYYQNWMAIKDLNKTKWIN